MCPCSLYISVQAEIVNIQKEKERIATTTIDDELAADPQMAKVGSWRHTWPSSWGTGAACLRLLLLSLPLTTTLCVYCVCGAGGG